MTIPPPMGAHARIWPPLNAQPLDESGRPIEKGYEVVWGSYWQRRYEAGEILCHNPELPPVRATLRIDLNQLVSGGQIGVAHND